MNFYLMTCCSSGMERRDYQLAQSCVQERFKQLLRLSRWTDCTFKVGEHDVEVIHGHKLVLAVSSPVFEALFFGPLASPTDTVIPVPDIEPHTFRNLLQYVYSDETRVTSIEEAGELLYAAKKYLVEPLSDLCLDYLVQHTWVRTLWHVLEVAQALSEEGLLAACLKVMCRYHYEVWGCESERLSGEVLRKLLEQGEMMMSEAELWEMAAGWAGKEAEYRGLEDTPDTRRRLMEEEGLLERLRLLAVPPAHLDRLTPVLTQAEVDCMREKKEVPPGFSNSLEARRPALPLFWRSTREILGRKNGLWVSRGEVICRISSTARVLVVGFEVLTRTTLAPFAPDSSYRERLAISVKDSQDALLQKTDYDTSVLFNTSQKIQLSKPLWFEENETYTVHIGYIGGQYPYWSVANDCSSRLGAKFYFDEAIIVEGNRDKIISSYIISVLYAL